jgi:2-methylcitrate dehydratase PrpD
MSGQIQTVAERLAAILSRPVSVVDRVRARLHVLDWAGCVSAGAVEPGAAEPRALAALEGAGVCRVVGGRRAGPQAAALANGPMGALLEMDDVDKRGLLHPGPVVMPAALAAAEAAGVTDGNAFLDAVVRGYEAMIRVGRAAGPGHYRYFHATGTCGPFGAAAAAASLLSLSPLETAWALANAGQQAAGLWQVRHEPVFTKALHDGRAAANGVAAAFLAHEGYAGPLSHFEGPQGFFAALCDGADPEAVVAGPDAGWAIHEVSFKPHAACRHAHAAIDAVLVLRAQALDRTMVRLEVASYRDALTFCDRPDPRTSGEAKFSLQHAAAAAWAFGDADLERFTPQAIASADLVALRSRVSVRENAGSTARYPARFGARAAAVLEDGTRLEVEVADALGDPEQPVTPVDLEAKARKLMAWGGLNPAQTDRLCAACLGLGSVSQVAELSAALPGTDA